MAQIIDVPPGLGREKLPPRRSAAPATVGGAAVVAAIVAAGVLAVLLTRWVTGTGYRPSILGLADPGQVTSLGLPVAQLVHSIAGTAVVGLLFCRCLGAGTGSAGDDRLGRLIRRWSWVWVGSTAVWMLFTVSDLVGVSVAGLPVHADSVVLVLTTSRVLAQIATLWVGVAAVMFGDRPFGRVGMVAALLLGLGALVPSSLTGHAGHHASPALAASALAVHVAAAGLWVGGLLAIVVHLRSDSDQLRVVLPRFSVAALLCALAVGTTGVVEAVVSLDGWDSLFSSNRGELILIKSGALVALMMFGFAHRRRTVPAAAAGRVAPLLRLAALELALMGATIGVAVTLSTTA